MPKVSIGSLFLVALLAYVSLILYPGSNFWRFLFYWWSFLWGVRYLNAVVWLQDFILSTWSAWLFGAGIVVLPILGAMLGIWVAWHIPFALLAIFSAVVIANGLYRRRRFAQLLEQEASLDHPLGQDVRWMIAVSRRFSSQRAVEIYQKTIRPVLERHGHIVECFYADDSQESEDFWINRMRVIFELADFHILVEHDMSARVFVEHMSSMGMIVPQPRRPMLGAIFGEDHPLSGADPRPSVIILSPSARRQVRTLNLRCCVLPIRGDSTIAQSEARLLDETIILFKRRHRLDYTWAAINEFGWSGAAEFLRDEGVRRELTDIRFARNDLAQALSDPNQVSEYRQVIASVKIEVSNKSSLMAFLCDYLDGKADFPKGFLARYLLLSRLFEESMGTGVLPTAVRHILLGPKVADLAIRLPRWPQKIWASSKNLGNG